MVILSENLEIGKNKLITQMSKDIHKYEYKFLLDLISGKEVSEKLYYKIKEYIHNKNLSIECIMFLDYLTVLNNSGDLDKESIIGLISGEFEEITLHNEVKEVVLRYDNKELKEDIFNIISVMVEHKKISEGK